MKYIDYIVEVMKVQQFVSIEEKKIEKIIPDVFFEFFGKIELGGFHWDRLCQEMGDFVALNNVDKFLDNKETPEEFASHMLILDPTLANEMTDEEIMTLKNELRDHQSNLTTLNDNLKSVGVHFDLFEQIDLLKIEKML